MIVNKKAIISDCKMLLKQLTDCSELEKELDRLQMEANLVVEMLRKAIDENAREAINQEEYNRQYDELETRHKLLTAKYDEVNAEIQHRKFLQNNFRLFISTIKNAEPLTEFSPEAWTALVETVTVNAKDDIRFNFRNGMSLTAAI